MNQQPTHISNLIIRPFNPKDQGAVRTLILNGLGEHWEKVDATLNPDLDDIQTSYANAIFLVAEMDKQIVGTGALIPRTSIEAEIVRMSVAASVRRKGVGKSILQKLCLKASQSGFQRIILETMETWHEAIAFYRQFGFHITHTKQGEYGGEVYFALDLTNERK